MKENVLNAVRLLKTATNGSFNIWDLAGPRNGKVRQEVMSALMGQKTPVSQCGVTLLMTHFLIAMDLVGLGGCQAVREEMLANKCNELLAPPATPREKQLEDALRGMLDMLATWNDKGDGFSGFSGFEAVNRAEELLGLPLSSVR